MSDLIYPKHDYLKPLMDQMHERWPATMRDGHPCVPAAHAPAIADFLTSVVAELVESYLDAGSERDAIGEEIGPHMDELVKGWTEQD